MHRLKIGLNYGLVLCSFAFTMNMPELAKLKNVSRMKSGRKQTQHCRQIQSRSEDLSSRHLVLGGIALLDNR